MGLVSLFIIGISIDIAGVIFLSKGLVLSPTSIMTISSPHWGWDAPKMANFIKVRIEAIFGLFGIGLGFVLQLLGYLLVVTYHIAYSPPHPLGTFIACVLVLIAYYVIWRCLSPLLLKRLTLKVVQNQEKKDNKDETIRERIRMLQAIGDNLGYTFKGQGAEEQRAHVLKTYNITLEDLK